MITSLNVHLVVLLNVILQLFKLLFLQGQQLLLLLQLCACITQEVNLFFGDLLTLQHKHIVKEICSRVSEIKLTT